MDHAVHGLLLLWMITAATQILLHWLIIRRRLRQHGGPVSTGFLPWRIFHELGRYRDLLRADARTLNAYHFYLILLWFNLLLGSTIGLLALWQRTSLTGSAP
jgi:hypothetical protein